MRTEVIPDGLEGPKLDKWLRRKSAELMARKARSTAPPGSLPVDVLVARYMLERHRLRKSTLTQYRYSLAKFEAYVGSKPLSQALLWAWRASLDRPGTAAASVNRDLAHVSAFLHHFRKSGDLLLTEEQISTGLQRLPNDAEKKTPLSRAELNSLVQRLNAPGVPPTYRSFVLVVLLTGMRVEECRTLQPDRVELDSSRIVLRKVDTKTKRGRTIDLTVSPTVIRLLQDFDGWHLTRNEVRTLRERLHPGLTFQRMRVTCGTYLTCAPSIYGGASAYMSAARLGHSVSIAEKHYVGVVQVDPAANTLEAALGLECGQLDQRDEQRRAGDRD